MEPVLEASVLIVGGDVPYSTIDAAVRAALGALGFHPSDTEGQGIVVHAKEYRGGASWISIGLPRDTGRFALQRIAASLEHEVTAHSVRRQPPRSTGPSWS